jgi:hypothetical protein
MMTSYTICLLIFVLFVDLGITSSADVEKIAKKSETLDVYLVPHTHADLCWKETMQEYFDDTVRRHTIPPFFSRPFPTPSYPFIHQVHDIYDTVLAALVQDKSLKFSVAEIGFFRAWWEQAKETPRADFTRILNEKRFEFVGGGYSQPDEAANDGPALVRNMMSGHTWISMTFGEEALPTVSWSLDPFGQTPTAMSLFKQMGFTDAVIDRIPFSTKDKLVEEDSLEFLWRVREFNEEPTEDELMFTHVLHAKYHFGNSGRISPDIDRLYWGPQASDHTNSFLIDSIPRAARALARQITEQSEGQRHNKVLVLFGKDFAFQNATQEFSQMSPLVDWISEHGMKLDPPMRIKYATGENEEN